MKSIRRGLIATIGAGMIVAAVASFASADVTCPSGKACAWAGAHYSGNRDLIDGSQQGTGWHNFGQNRESGKNRFSVTAKSIVFANDQNGGGAVWCMWPGDEAHDFYPQFVTANSYKVVGNFCAGYPH